MNEWPEIGLGGVVGRKAFGDGTGGTLFSDASSSAEKWMERICWHANNIRIAKAHFHMSGCTLSMIRNGEEIWARTKRINQVQRKLFAEENKRFGYEVFCDH